MDTEWTQMSKICIQYSKCFELNKTAIDFRNVTHNTVLHSSEGLHAALAGSVHTIPRFLLSAGLQV